MAYKNSQLQNDYSKHKTEVEALNDRIKILETTVSEKTGQLESLRLQQNSEAES